MDGYRASVFLHIFAAVLLVGQALFWSIMYAALKQQFDAARVSGYLQILKQSKWPHVAIPHSLRLPLPIVGWVTIMLLILTGVAIVVTHAAPGNAWWWTKIALFMVLLVIQGLLTRRVGAKLIYANLFLVVALAVISGLMVRA